MSRQLSPREAEVVLARIEYGSSKAAADSLGITLQTVKNHTYRAMMKLGADDFVHLTRMVYRQLNDDIIIRHRDGSVTTATGRYANGERLHR